MREGCIDIMMLVMTSAMFLGTEGYTCEPVVVPLNHGMHLATVTHLAVVCDV